MVVNKDVAEVRPSFPNVLVIGAMKSGTTSLHDYLNRHPKVFMSATKELNFFLKERNWSRGPEWYRSQFDAAFPIRGESSESYSKLHHFSPGVAERIKSLVPDVRLIYIVRDPIERIVSHYHEAIEGGYAPPQGMNAYLREDIENNHYVLTSSYYMQIMPFVNAFGLDKIFIATLEGLGKNRLMTMNEIFGFLGVDRILDDSEFDFVRNAGTEKRAFNALGRLAIGRSTRALRAFLPRSVKERIKKSEAMLRIATTPVVRETLDPVLADNIRDVLRPDVELFRRLTGLKLEGWTV